MLGWIKLSPGVDWIAMGWNRGKLDKKFHRIDRGVKKLQEKMDNTIKLIEARNRYTSKKTDQIAEQNDKKNTTEPSPGSLIMETVSNENFVILNNTIASLSYTLQEHESHGFFEATSFTFTW